MTLPLATSPGEVILQAAILAVLLAVSAGLWIWVCTRWQRGEPIIPLARRRPVPWQAQDVLFIFLMGLFLSITAAKAVKAWMGPEAEQRAADQKPELAHPAEQLLRSGNPAAIAVAVTMAIVVAPLVEEFFFRVLLQGWLEAVWSRRRRRHPELRAAPVSWIPIVLPAALFALMHRPFQRSAACAAVSDRSVSRADGSRSPGARLGDRAVAVRRRGRPRPIWAGSRRNSAPTPNWACWPSWP